MEAVTVIQLDGHGLEIQRDAYRVGQLAGVWQRYDEFQSPKPGAS